MTMQMKVLNLVIGSPEWKEIRGKYKVASEAPAMMGADPNFKRSDLLRLKSTGIEREINEWVQAFVFKKGHETEAKARPIAEARLGDNLYPLCIVNEVEGLQVLASYDGITSPMYDLHWEHKQFNKELFATVQAEGELPPKIYWQLEHQLLVNGNDLCLFAVSDGTETNYAEMEYHSRPERRAQLIAGWKLFDKDLAAYVPEEIQPVVVGEVIKDLPALHVEVVSEVRKSNLAVYRANMLDFVANINEDLQTDQDFATAKNVVKFLEDKEKELATITKKILDGSDSTSELMRSLTQLHETMRTKRLALNTLVTTEEQNRKAEVIIALKSEWHEYYAQLNSELPANAKMPEISPDFAKAVKARKTLATYKEAARNELVRAKIEADNWKDHIADNLAMVNALAAEHMFLFNDLHSLLLKDKEALEAIAKNRINEHKIKDEAKIKAAADRIAAENERKRKEDEDKRIAAEAAEASRKAQEAPRAPTPTATPARAASVTAAPVQGRLIPASPAPTQTATPAMSDRRTSTVSYSLHKQAPMAKLSPPDSDIITAVAIAFNVDNATALDWIANINIAEARRLASQVG